MTLLIVFKLFIALIILFIPGYLTAILIKPNNWGDKIALGFCFGLGINGLILFTLSIMSINATFFSILILEAIIVFILLILNLKNKNPLLNINLNFKWRLSFLENVLLTYLSIKVALIFFSSLIKPVVTWDAWARYSLIAKAIFIKGTLIHPFILGRMEDYPPLIMLNQAWILICQGNWNDISIKIISPLLFVSLIYLFYFNLKRWINAKSSLIYTALLASLPFIVYHSSSAYLDLPLTAFYGISTIYLYAFMKQENKSDLMISFLLLAFSVWIKRGGIYLTAFNLTLLINYLLIKNKYQIRLIINNFWSYFAILATMIIPWLIFKQFMVAQHYYTFNSLAKDSLNSDLANNIIVVLQVVTSKLFFTANWHLLIALLIVSILFFFKNTLAQNTLLGIIILNCLALFIVFTFASSFKFLLDGTLLNRILIYIMPIVLLYCATSIGDIFSKKES